MKIKDDDIERNFKNVEEGRALDIPLAVLNSNFKRRCYANDYNKDEVRVKQVKEYMKVYRKKPENRKRIRMMWRRWYRKKFNIPESKCRIK